MKNLIFWWGIFFALVCVIVMFGMTAFGQNPQVVEMQPLINMEEFFEPLKEWFFDILSQYWVILLTIFVGWFSLMCVLSYLDGMVQRRLAIRRYRQHIKDRKAAWEFERAGNQEYSREERIERMVGRMSEREEATRLFRERETQRWQAEQVKRAFDGYEDNLRKAYEEHERETGVYKTSTSTSRWSDETMNKFRSIDYANDYKDISRWNSMQYEGAWDSQTDDAYFEAAYRRDSIFDSYGDLGRAFAEYRDDHDKYMSLYSDKFSGEQYRIWVDTGEALYSKRKELDDREESIIREYESLGGGKFHDSVDMQRAWRDGYSSHERGGY